MKWNATKGLLELRPEEIPALCLAWLHLTDANALPSSEPGPVDHIFDAEVSELAMPQLPASEPEAEVTLDWLQDPARAQEWAQIEQRVRQGQTTLALPPAEPIKYRQPAPQDRRESGRPAPATQPNQVALASYLDAGVNLLLVAVVLMLAGWLFLGGKSSAPEQGANQSRSELRG